MRNPFEKINLSKETKYFLYGFGAASAFLTLGGILKIVKKARAKKSSPKHVKAKHVKQRTVKVAGLEIGGTSCLVAIGEKTIDDSGNILDIRFVDERKKLRVDTTNPKETLGAMMSFIKNEIFEEIGIASFGPLCLDENKDSYGHIMKTPKKKWVNFDILSFVKERIPLSAGVPALDTDVNAPALLEYLKGGHKVTNSLAYITVGTGVGIGLIINGKPVHGLLHPEGGHILVRKNSEEPSYKGVCEFHENCVEGLVTNKSIAKRKHLDDVHKVAELPDSDPVWDIIAFYLGQFCMTLTLVCSPEVIVIGGGIAKRKILFNKIRENFKNLLNGYLVHEKLEKLEDYIKPASFSEDAGIFGAFLIAGRAN